MTNKLRSLLCLVLTLLMVSAAVPSLAAPVPVTDFSITGENIGLGTGIFYEGEALALTGHKLQLGVANVQPNGAALNFTYKSSKPSVASVNAKGVVTCKKAGTTQITITSKHGNVKRDFLLNVAANEASYSEPNTSGLPSGFSTTAKRVYIKGGKLMVDMYLYNGGTRTVKKIASAPVYFSFDPETSNYTLRGNFKGSVKKAIKPGQLGVVTFTLGKITASEAILLYADAYCEGTITYKGEGEAPVFDRIKPM